jgi:hypothetical protein
MDLPQLLVCQTFETSICHNAPSSASHILHLGVQPGITGLDASVNGAPTRGRPPDWYRQDARRGTSLAGLTFERPNVLSILAQRMPRLDRPPRTERSGEPLSVIGESGGTGSRGDGAGLHQEQGRLTTAPGLAPTASAGLTEPFCILLRRRGQARWPRSLPGSQMSPTRHCKHCWGDCPGDCLLPGVEGRCIHKTSSGPPLRDWPRVMITRRFWRWFLWR